MTRLRFRGDTAANWASVNPILAEDEPGREQDTGKEKRGNGTDPWNDLPYFGGGASDFSDLGGDPYANTALAAALNAKLDADDFDPADFDAAGAAAAAQTAAIAAAALDATTKANAAQAAATATASGDATTKANAAQAAAEATAAADATTKATAAKAYADTLVVGLVDDRGNFDASGNTFPASGGSGSAGAVLKGDLWTVSVAGTLGGNAVTSGDLVRALVDAPGQTAGNWAVTENNIGYVAENAANRDIDAALTANSDTKYASQKAVKTFVTNAIGALSTVYQAASAVLSAFVALTPSNDDFLQRKSGAWANRTIAQVKTDLGLTGTNSGDQDLSSLAPKASPTFTGNHAVSEANLQTGVISPAALAANTNDWAPGSFSTCSVVRASASAAVALTGLAGGAAGRLVTIHNVGSFDLLLTNEDAGSTAANRFAIRRGLILAPNKGITLWYDGTSSRWRLAADQDRSVTTVLAADQTNNNAVADTMQDITGLSCQVLAGKTYKFRFVVAYTSAASTTGCRFSISGPAVTNLTYLTDNMGVASYTSTHLVSGHNSSYDVPSSASSGVPATGAPGPFLSVTWGVITPSADGTLIGRFASEVAGSAIVAKAGLSYVEYECISG